VATKPAEQAILKTPVRKGKPCKPADAPASRRSDRLAEKALKKGSMCAEKMAQEVFCKKLEGAVEHPDKEKQDQDQLIKLFDALLPEDAIEAIEDLLKVISLEGEKEPALKKGDKRVVI
jgi:hypothetical protein